MTKATDERKELGAFLVSRRGRLKPAELGLPIGARRTPGLRREEVASLAGISVSWYTWLEQGRDISVSSTTLRRLARVLRLDRTETEHLIALSSPRREEVAGSAKLSDALFDLVQAVDPVPAYVRNPQLDILAWNPAMADLFVDYGALAEQARNTLYLMFLHAPYRRLIRDWEDVARGTIGVFRAARAKASDKAQFDMLASTIAEQSEQFRLWWPEVDVQGFYEGEKRINHPSRGALDLTYVALTSEDQPTLSFVTYLARPLEGD